MTVPTASLPPKGADVQQPAGTVLGLETEVTALLRAATERTAGRELPLSTYRLQFHAGFTFRQAAEVVPYLASLGISHCYSAPYLQARPGSRHGYDVVDHSQLNREIGGRNDYREFIAQLRQHGLGQILDVVPNHMSVASDDNAWWIDLLENGPSSAYAAFFDIDWMPLKPDLAHRVLLPVLGDQFGKVLEDGQLVLAYEDGSFWVRYSGRRFPLAPRSFIRILERNLEELKGRVGEEHPDLVEYLSILTAIRNLPPSTTTDAVRREERQREKEVVKRRLLELTQRSPTVAAFVAENVRALNGRRGDPHSFDALDQLLREQSYRLAHWRVAADEINYRRFFDNNELAAICVEVPEVFERTHRLVFELVGGGAVSGLRIDHPDGLYDPTGYLEQLQEYAFLHICRQAWEASGAASRSADRWPELAERLSDWWRHQRRPDSPLTRPLFVVVEKILGHGEELPGDWLVHGTVGYEFLSLVGGVLVNAAAEKPLSANYARFTGETLDYDELAYQCKRLVAKTAMASELTVLGHRLDRIAQRNRWSMDFTRPSLTRALQEVIAGFRVYRTYISDGHVLARDRQYVESAVAHAKRRNPDVNPSIFDFVRDMLLLRYRENADDTEREAQRRFVGKFQQLTGPIMAKAIEDTAFYRYNRLTSLNEVGGEPRRFGTTVAEFHQHNQRQRSRSSRSLLATSTHDTKRSEDVRARIHVLSEVPGPWRASIFRWRRWNKRLKIDVEGEPAPSRNDEYLLYQTLVGIWPGLPLDAAAIGQLVERLQEYLLKAGREAKVNTSWVNPHEAYESAVRHFVAGLFDPPSRPFVEDLDRFVRSLSDHGISNSLSQLVLKLASPGVADFFQGMELWTYTLVDPDNRRPVDFALRRRLLDDLKARWAAARPAANKTNGAPAASTAPIDPQPVESGEAQPSDAAQSLIADLVEHRHDGRIKLFVTWRGLALRRQHRQVFLHGDYIPLEAGGPHAQHVVALARQYQRETILAIVPRLTVGLSGFGGPPPLADLWQDTIISLPPPLIGRSLENAFTGERLTVEPGEPGLPLADALRHFPVAMFLATDEGDGRPWKPKPR